MTGALIIRAALLITGFALYIHHRATGSDSVPVVQPADDTECCGQHAICEKTSLLVADDTIVYFDDEELDRLAGRNPETFTAEEVEELRDVMLTLAPEDVAPWARSLTLRQILLPQALRDELLMLVDETRQESER